MRSTKLLGILLSCVPGSLLLAQPVLDQATSIPALGTTYGRSIHMLTNNVPLLPTTGSAVLWDLSTLNFLNPGVNDTSVVVPAGTTPYANEFPLASVALHAYNYQLPWAPLLEWRYFAVSPDSCGTMGFANSSGWISIVDPLSFNVPLPLSYQDSWAAWDSSIVFSYGAYGTMITPWGDTLSDVIMITWDLGVNGPPWHAWYRADNLLDALGTYDPDFNSLQLTQRLPISGTGVQELDRPAPRIAPNPATDVVQLVVPDLRNGTLRLFDHTGRLVLHQALSGKTHRVQLNGIGPGCYVVQVIDDRGRTGNTRLVVQ